MTKFRDKEKAKPGDYHFVNLYNEIAIKSDGQINGEQFTIEKCKVGFSMLKPF